jgi:hypothetical protein
MGGMEQITSRVVHENAWMSVREDQVRLPDGTPGVSGVVDKPDFALIIPCDSFPATVMGSGWSSSTAIRLAVVPVNSRRARGARPARITQRTRAG